MRTFFLAILMAASTNAFATEAPCLKMLKRYGYAAGPKQGRVVASVEPSSEDVKQAMKTVAKYIDDPATSPKDLRTISRYLLKAVRSVERSKRVTHGQVMQYLSATVQAMNSPKNPYKNKGGLAQFMSECRFSGIHRVNH